MFHRNLIQLATACSLCLLVGCSTPGFFKSSKNEFPKAGPKNPVGRIVGIWEPADGMFKGKSCRGFSAQILFFGQASGDVPTQVDGDVRIYVFDDQGTEEQQAIPIHQFDYPAATWNAFFGPGPLGATYCVFVPYTRPGIHEAKCSLRIRYTPKNGFPAYSDMVNVVLPGKKKPGAKDEEAAESISFANPAAAGPATTQTTEPARARPVATALPTAQEIQEQLRVKKPKAVQLTAAEERRIMRETMARLKSEEPESRIQLAGYEEEAEDQDRPAANHRRAGNRVRNIPVTAVDELDDLDTPEARPLDTRSPRASADDELDEDF